MDSKFDKGKFCLSKIFYSYLIIVIVPDRPNFA